MELLHTLELRPVIPATGGDNPDISRIHNKSDKPVFDKKQKALKIE